MGEIIKKQTQQTRKWNPIAVQQLSDKYGLTKRYIRQCLNRYRINQTSDTIIKEYGIMVKGIEEVINNNKILSK